MLTAERFLTMAKACEIDVRAVPVARLVAFGRLVEAAVLQQAVTCVEVPPDQAVALFERIGRSEVAATPSEVLGRLAAQALPEAVPLQRPGADNFPGSVYERGRR